MDDRSIVDKVVKAIRKLSRTDRLSEEAIAQAAIDAMQLTPQSREIWPPEESGVSGPLHQICWQTETTRKGELQACDKPAVAVAIDEDEHWYPVCAYHTRSRILVPLADLLCGCTGIPVAATRWVSDWEVR